MFTPPSTSRRPSSAFMSASATPLSASRRSSYSDPTMDGTVPHPSSSSTLGVSTPEDGLQVKATSTSPILDFAKMRNPTIAIRLGTHFSVELTYAALLQYASVLLCIPRSVQLFQQPAIHSVGTASAHPYSYLLLSMNAAVLLLAAATIEVRQKSEKLGLRRTSLMLCTLLFVLALLLAVLPTHRQSLPNVAKSASTMPTGSRAPYTTSTDIVQDELLDLIHRMHAADIDVLCNDIQKPSEPILISTPAKNGIHILCRD